MVHEGPGGGMDSELCAENKGRGYLLIVLLLLFACQSGGWTKSQVAQGRKRGRVPAKRLLGAPLWREAFREGAIPDD